MSCSAVGSTVCTFAGDSASAGDVTSVFGRIGAVVAVAGDYTASQVTNNSGVVGAFVDDALDALEAAIAALDTGDIANASGVAGATATDALNALGGAIVALQGVVAALNSSDIANASGVAGATVTDALNALAAAFAGFVPTSRTLTAGAGMTGGGTMAADRTFDVAANADGSIIVNANDVQVGILATDAQHGNRGGGTQHAVATTVDAGFMSAADKAKLDAIDAVTATDIYLDAVGGNDITGDGTIGNPYKDLPRGVEDIPVNSLGTTFIHFKPGDYTGILIPKSAGPVILYADEAWDPLVFIVDFSGVTDVGTDGDGITDAGLTPGDFDNMWLEVNGERKMVLRNTATRINPVRAFETVFADGVDYEIFHSDVRITFAEAASIAYFAVQTGARCTSLAASPSVATPVVAAAGSPYVGCVGIEIHAGATSSVEWVDGQYAFYGTRGFVNDITNHHGVDNAAVYAGSHQPLLNAMTAKLGGTLLWEGWGWFVDGEFGASEGVIAVVGEGFLTGYFSTGLLRNEGFTEVQSPGNILWRGGRIGIAIIGLGSVLEARELSITPSAETCAVLGLPPAVSFTDTPLLMRGGVARLVTVIFEDLLGPLVSGTGHRVEVSSFVTGEGTGGLTVDVQGASVVACNGAPALGGAGNDWQVGTAAAFNKAALAAVNSAVVSIGSVALRQS